jgi:chemotaxis protein methyltransferase WspC
MVQAALVALLRHTIGLNPDAIGAETIARGVRQRMAQCAMSDMQTYLERLQTSDQELHALIEEVVVPETWFFRDQMPFAYLGQYVMTEWLPSHQHAMLRVLSVGCSTGEEPYSIAMTLLDTGLAPQHVCIEAVDISRKALCLAQRAVYDTHSFRGNNLGFRARYLEASMEGYRVCERVRSMVTLLHGNVLAPHFLADREPYDVIFCRNLLIYFDAAAKSRALQVLDRLLAPHGRLFVGYAETGLFLTSGYMSVRYPRAFAYRKGDRHHDPPHPPLLSSSARPHTPPGTRQPTAAAPVHQRPPSSAEPGVVAQKLSVAQDTQASALESAGRLADQGELEAAARLCETAMRAYGPSAQAYVLLGLIRQAVGNLEQAEHCFGRAVYLQPDHYEALIHLAFLLERRGDTARAAVLRQRARRACHQAR